MTLTPPPRHFPFANGTVEAQMRYDPGPAHMVGRAHPRTLAHDGLLVHNHFGCDSRVSLTPALPCPFCLPCWRGEVSWETRDGAGWEAPGHSTAEALDPHWGDGHLIPASRALPHSPLEDQRRRAGHLTHPGHVWQPSAALLTGRSQQGRRVCRGRPPALRRARCPPGP